MIFLILFFEFFKIGLFAVGGGLATLPFLYELANKYSWFSVEELANMIAVSESTPGPIGINMATYVGFHSAYETSNSLFLAVLGAITTTIGLVLPSLIVIIIVAIFLEKFNKNKYVKAVFGTLHPVVAGLIAAACFELYKIAIFTVDKAIQTGSIYNLIDLKSTIIFAIILILAIKFKKHPIVYIALGAALSLVSYIFQ